MSPGPALSTLATKDGGANDGGRKPDQPATLPLDSVATHAKQSGGTKPKKLPLIAEDVERVMRGIKDTLPLMKEALSRPTNLDPDLAATFAARIGRVALAWSRTPDPVADYVEQLQTQCSQQQLELSEKNKILDRVLDQRDRSRNGGKKGGRPPIDDYVTELIDAERIKGSLLKKRLDFNVAAQLNPGNPLAEVRKVQRARQALTRSRAKRLVPKT